MAQEPKSEGYKTFAPRHDAIEALPISALYQQQVEYALGTNCKGLTVLDLGGGIGLHARKAIDRGAKLVDVVDMGDLAEVGELGEALPAGLVEEQRVGVCRHDGQCPGSCCHASLHRDVGEVVLGLPVASSCSYSED